MFQFQVTAIIHLGLIIFEDISIHLNGLGLFQQFLHALLLKDFPVFRLTSITFVSAVLNLVLHHYLAFKFFGTTYYGFSEVSLILFYSLTHFHNLVKPQGF